MTSSCGGYRCHRCILAVRSDFFRALLQQSRPQHSSVGPGKDDAAALPAVAVGEVQAAAFGLVLQFMYSDAVQGLPQEFMQAHAAEELFDAADRLLLFTMKVRNNAWEL